jgi:lysine 6-dehydrogenase
MGFGATAAATHHAQGRHCRPTRGIAQGSDGGTPVLGLYVRDKAESGAASLRSPPRMSPPLSAAVLGAAGTIAPAIVHDLAVSDEVERIALLDLDADRAAAVVRQYGADKATSSAVDARAEDQLAAALGDVEVLVNAASYRVNVHAMRACLEAGCAYLDLGGLYWMTGRQLELSDEFGRAGLLAVLGIGSSPGKTNLMAERAIEVLDVEPGAIETIDIVAAGRDPLAADDGRLRPPYALQTLLDELTLSPVVLRGGRPIELEPLHPGGVADFGEPIGRADTTYTLHSELRTFADSFGCRSASFRLSLAPRLLAGLRDLVGKPADDIAAAAQTATAPSPETVSIHLVKVTAESGASVTVRARTDPWAGLGGSVVSTAAPAAAAVRLIARGSLDAIGALPPEQCIEPGELFAELETRNCAFSVTGPE